MEASEEVLRANQHPVLDEKLYKIAVRLEREGFDTEVRSKTQNRIALHRETTKSAVDQYIETKATKDGLETIEDVLDELNAAETYQTISPSNCSALPDWPSDQKDKSMNTATRPIFIVPQETPFTTPRQKAVERASIL